MTNRCYYYRPYITVADITVTVYAVAVTAVAVVTITVIAACGFHLFTSLQHDILFKRYNMGM